MALLCLRDGDNAEGEIEHSSIAGIDVDGLKSGSGDLVGAVLIEAPATPSGLDFEHVGSEQPVLRVGVPGPRTGAGAGAGAAVTEALS
mmetsp:Transcript_25068/g.55601  ORF Transcript_25068/g.55601 Transcript_25068/m.55601 type:complete len:88 (+) Transcript_25068:218-481(+)